MNYAFIALGLIVGFYFFKKFMISNINYKELLNKGAIIVDVRTPQEFDAGHINGSMNIPLNILPQRIEILKSKNVPIICVCASGMRSGSAVGQLKNAGVECYNGGGWSNVNRKLN